MPRGIVTPPREAVLPVSEVECLTLARPGGEQPPKGEEVMVHQANAWRMSGGGAVWRMVR